MNSENTTSPSTSVLPEGVGGPKPKFAVRFGPNAGITAVLLVIFAILALTTPTFRQLDSFQNLAQQVSIYSIIGVGMTFVIITAGIDLSVGSVQGLVGVITAGILMSPSVVAKFGAGAMVLAVIGGMGAGLAAGLFNGLAITRLRMQPFIVTLATMWAFRGLAEVMTNGSPIGTVPPNYAMAAERNSILQNKFTMIGMGYVGPVPISAFIALLIILVAHIVLSRSTFGRHVYVVGANREAARLAGINVERTLLLVYTISGLLSALAAIILMSKLVSGQPTAGQGYELFAIAAVVVGGVSLFGGTGNVVGSAIGALIIGTINMGLDLNGISAFWQQIVTGGLILFAVLIDDLVRRRKG